MTVAAPPRPATDASPELLDTAADCPAADTVPAFDVSEDLAADADGAAAGEDPPVVTAAPGTAVGDADPNHDWLVVLFARFLGTEKSRALLSVGDQAVVSATNFATSVLVGWAAGKAGLGVYGLAVSLILFVRGIQEQIVYGPYLVFCHKRRGNGGWRGTPAACWRTRASGCWRRPRGWRGWRPT